MNRTKKSCPCCSFDLDLFLPDSEKQNNACVTIEEDGHSRVSESLPNIAETFHRLVDIDSDSYIDSDSDTGIDNGIDGEPGERQRDDRYRSPIVIVDTHGHAQLDRERDETYRLDPDPSENDTGNKSDDDGEEDKEESESATRTLTSARTRTRTRKRSRFLVKSLACSVEPADFEATLKHASQSDSVLPALGVHPWYIENLPIVSSVSGTATESESETPSGDNTKTNERVESETETKTETQTTHDVDSEWLLPMERLLLEHPSCLVGEIGLCKIAKWVRTHPSGKAAAMEIQKRVFKKQMVLAAKLRRPVSVHCVNSHGIFVAAIRELVETTTTTTTKTTRTKENDDAAVLSGGSRRYLLPPAIAMHSFTGTAHHVKELLELEHRIDFPNDRSRKTRNKKKAPKTDARSQENETTNAKAAPVPPPSSSSLPPPPLFYFGFSHTVNYAMCTSEKSRAKGKEAVRAVPLDRLLVESDVHSDADVAGGTIGAISYVSWARDLPPMDVVSATTRNGSAFLGSVGTQPQSR